MAQKIRMIHTSGVVKYHNAAYANSEYAAKDGWIVQDPAIENDTPVAEVVQEPQTKNPSIASIGFGQKWEWANRKPVQENINEGSQAQSAEPITKATPAAKRGRKAKTK